MYIRYTMIPLVKIGQIHWFIAYTYEKDIEKCKVRCLQELSIYDWFYRRHVQFLYIFLFASITFIVFKKQQSSYFGAVNEKLFHVFLKWISCRKWSQGIFPLLFFIFNFAFEINFSTLHDTILSLSPASDTVTVSE